MLKSLFDGVLYKENSEELQEQINSLHESEFGPGSMSVKRGESRVYGIIVPYSQYSFAGAAMAWGYKLIAESYFPETYVIIVPDSKGSFVNYVTVFDDFETVFGVCKVDLELARNLIAQGVVSLTSNLQEFSLEVQLPMLMNASKDRINDLKILPIVVPNLNNYEILIEEILKLKKDIVVIIAAEMSPYGLKYMYLPFMEEIDENISKQDMNLIKSLVDFDTESYLRFVQKNRIPILGKNCVVLGVQLIKQLGCGSGELVCYYRSSHLNNDDSNSVGFGVVVY
jgi:AmmeMemoRadiSam system protein B